jgi:hypothetical protein
LTDRLCKRQQGPFELSQRLGHVRPTEADPHMGGLVVHGSWKEQHAGPGQPLAQRVDVADAARAGESDRAGRGTNPVEDAGVPREEVVQQRQVALDDREVSLEQDVA